MRCSGRFACLQGQEGAQQGTHKETQGVLEEMHKGMDG